MRFGQQMRYFALRERMGPGWAMNLCPAARDKIAAIAANGGARRVA